ncbi:sensor histidine kinase [Dictyobacter halimunensis]|uniref:sensor histidine kinase n=1 Tax=Dictyobacter halimunensis TaxID=3026934 RepID=UPI0030C76631
MLVALLANRLMTPPHFIWAPFCLVTVLVGFFWGVGPALITLILGLLTFVFFVVIPQYHFLTWNIASDFMLFGPFIFAQVIIALLAAQHEVQYRRVLRMRRKLQSSAEELAVTNQQLERANHLKDYFVTRAAHELRTPLTTILGEAQLALRRLNKLKEPATASLPWKKDIELIEGQARGMNILIDELIDLSSFRSGEVQLRLSRCDFGDLCRKVVENLRTISGRSLEFKRPSSPVILQADSERLSQLVTNIMRNAIQYSQEGTMVHINLSLEPSHALLRVHNDAPELSQEQQEHLFEPFYRTPYAEIMFREGWGLGLTMSKEIAKQHGGHIWVQSFKGEGFTCFVQIPISK